MVARINGKNVVLDFREVAPRAATRDMYLDSAGNMTDRSVTGALAAGVPGSVAGLFEAHRKYGTRPWVELVRPAMELAERGFVVDTSFTDDDEGGAERLAKDSASAGTQGSSKASTARPARSSEAGAESGRALTLQ